MHFSAGYLLLWLWTRVRFHPVKPKTLKLVFAASLLELLQKKVAVPPSCAATSEEVVAFGRARANQIKSFIILAVLRRSVLRVGGAHLRVIAPMGNTAPFEEMLQQWRVVGNTVSDLTGPRFDLQTSRSRDERVTARPTGLQKLFDFKFLIFSCIFSLICATTLVLF